jgi:MFS family permease
LKLSRDPSVERSDPIAALFPKSANADARRLIWAKSLRAIADGYVSILLPGYLLLLGYDSLQVGALTTATLLGSAALTLTGGLLVARFGHRRSLLAASGLMIFTGLSFAGFQAFWPLLVIAFVGTLNPSSGDVSVFLPLEQSLLTQSVADKDRTTLFARYSLAGLGSTRGRCGSGQCVSRPLPGHCISPGRGEAPPGTDP